jgi:hypothetical protein
VWKDVTGKKIFELKIELYFDLKLIVVRPVKFEFL